MYSKRHISTPSLKKKKKNSLTTFTDSKQSLNVTKAYSFKSAEETLIGIELIAKEGGK